MTILKPPALQSRVAPFGKDPIFESISLSRFEFALFQPVGERVGIAKITERSASHRLEIVWNIES